MMRTKQSNRPITALVANGAAVVSARDPRDLRNPLSGGSGSPARAIPRWRRAA